MEGRPQPGAPWGGLTWHPMVETSGEAPQGPGADESARWSICWWLDCDHLGARDCHGGQGSWKPCPDPIKASCGLLTGPGPLRTPPPGPGPGAGSALSVVKTEDGWAQRPPVSASCQLSKWTHSPAATSSSGCDGDTARVLVSRWGPAAQGETWGCLLGASHPGFSMHNKVLPASGGRIRLPLSSSSSSLNPYSPESRPLPREPSIVRTFVLQRSPDRQAAGHCITHVDIPPLRQG